MGKTERIFSKNIFIQSSGKRNLWWVPAPVMQNIYWLKRSWHRFECSRVFYMPRFVEEHPNYRFLKHGSPRSYLKYRGLTTYLYPYLQDINQRYKDLVELINLDGLNVVDLNAGHGNLVNYVPSNTRYRGNDIYPQAVHVEKSTDAEFVKSIKELDVLCIFGWATGGSFIESQTQDESLDYLLRKFKPQYFVAESISEYIVLITQRLAKSLLNYNIIASFEYNVGGRHPSRTMLVYELKSVSS